MTSRGIVTLQRPPVPIPPRITSGSTTVVGSNLFPLEREKNVQLYSYFVQYDEPCLFREKRSIICEILSSDSFSWVLDESGDVLYSVTSVAPGAYTREGCRISGGPRVGSEVLSLDSICRLVFQRLSKGKTKSGEIEIKAENSNDWFKIQLSGVSALSISPTFAYEETFCGKSLLDVFLSLGKDAAKTNQWISHQRGACIKVTCDHYGNGKFIVYSVMRLSDDSAKKKILEIDTNAVSVVDYFGNTLPGFKQWVVKLKFPDFPLAVDKKGRYLPLELCRIKNASTRKSVEKKEIEAFDLNQLKNHPLVASLCEFGVVLKLDKFLQARGRPLPACPTRNLPLVNRDSACGIISFVSDSDLNSPLSYLLEACSQRLGLRFDPDKVCVISLKVSHSWETEFKKYLLDLPIRPQIYFVFTDGRMNQETHERLKVVLDLKLRVPSQFLSLQTFSTKLDDPEYWDSLLQQIALKIGPSLPSAKPSGTVIGSIWVQNVTGTRIKALAMSLSYDNSMTMFTSQGRLALQRQQFDFAEIIYQSFLDWFKKCRCFPNRLIMFLQHPEEIRVFSNVADLLNGAQAAVSRINRELRTGINVKLGSGPLINPSWTFILCTKKCGVLVKAPAQDVAISSNFIASHGIEYMIKPANSKRSTRYSVVHDTNNFTVTELENFTHQICTPGAGFPVPVKHASRVVQRMNLYISSELKEAHMLDDSGKIQLLNQKLFDPEMALFSSSGANYL